MTFDVSGIRRRGISTPAEEFLCVLGHPGAGHLLRIWPGWSSPPDRWSSVENPHVGLVFGESNLMPAHGDG